MSCLDRLEVAQEPRHLTGHQLGRHALLWRAFVEGWVAEELDKVSPILIVHGTVERKRLVDKIRSHLLDLGRR